MNKDDVYAPHGNGTDHLGSPCVLAVVPVFNRIDETLACLARLTAQTYQPLEVVVVDGGSSDGTAEMIRSQYPTVRLHTGDGPLWWTDAVALAVDREVIRLTSRDYVFLVNNDTVLRDSTIECLVATSQRHGDAIVAAIVREEAGHLIPAGSKMTWGFHLADALGDDEEMIRRRDVLPADVVFGRATLVPVRTFQSIGNFDAHRFPQYYGDSDFSLRASRAGIPVVIDCKTAVACREHESTTGIHYVSNSRIGLGRAWQMATARKSNLNLLAAWAFMWRHSPGVQKPLCAAVLVFRHLSTISRLYLAGLGWPHRPLVVRSVFVLSLPFLAVRRLLRMRPLFMTFSELRRYGFDPMAMRNERQIRPSGIPHTYNVHLSRWQMVKEWKRHSVLIWRNYNPCVLLRVRRFCRRWSSGK